MKRSIGLRAHIAACDRGRLGLTGALERPVFLPRRAAIDPALEQSPSAPRSVACANSGGGIRIVASGVAHALIDQALGGLARNDGRAVGAGLEGGFPQVQAQAGHAGCAVGPVALKAVVGKDGADLPLEIDRRCCALCRGLRH